jgi:hypothetical protein
MECGAARCGEPAIFALSQIASYVALCIGSDDPRPDGRITEQQIGVHVFGWRPDYNPGEDSIVRSQARFLRGKLESYFSSEGADEPIHITIPKGTYVPLFEPRLVRPEQLLTPERPTSTDLINKANQLGFPRDVVDIPFHGNEGVINIKRLPRHGCGFG